MLECGNPGFYKLVKAIRKTGNPIFQKFGNPMIFETARQFLNTMYSMSIYVGEEAAMRVMLGDSFSMYLDESTLKAYYKIVERIGNRAWLDSHTKR